MTHCDEMSLFLSIYSYPSHFSDSTLVFTSYVSLILPRNTFNLLSYALLFFEKSLHFLLFLVNPSNGSEWCRNSMLDFSDEGEVTKLSTVNRQLGKGSRFSGLISLTVLTKKCIFKLSRLVTH